MSVINGMLSILLTLVFIPGGGPNVDRRIIANRDEC